MEGEGGARSRVAQPSLSPLYIGALGGRRPPRGPIYSGGEGGQPHPSPWCLPPPLLHLSLSQKLGEALPETRYIHHYAVVLLDLHQPLLPPCWIKKEETSSPTVRVLNTEVPSVRR